MANIKPQINEREERGITRKELRYMYRRLENEITVSNLTISNLEEERKGKLSKKENLKENKEKFAKELEEKEEELRKISQKLSSKELEIESKKKKVEELKEEKYTVENEITEQDVNFQNYENRKKQTEKELSIIISELDEKRMHKNDITSAFSKIEIEKNKIEEKVKQDKVEREALERKIKDLEIRINNLVDEQRLKKSKYNFLVETEKEKEGYTKSVKELLIACENDPTLKKGVHGILANIVSTDEKYNTAIEMCLGASLQNIVTQKEEDAKKLIEYLRINKLGRASFLPIEAVHGKKLENLKKGNGIIGLASDLVKYKKEYEGIVLNLLGRTVITENMDYAIALAKENKYSFRIVTLDGDIINPSGAITGGFVNKKTSNILGRSEEIKKLENEIKKLEEKIEILDKEKEEIKVDGKNKEIEENAKKLQEIEISYAREKEKLIQLEENINSIISRKEKLVIEKEELENKKKDSLDKKRNLQDNILNLQKQIEIISKEIEEFASLNKENQKYIDDLNLDITNLKISVSSFDESSTSMDEIIQRIEQSISNEKQLIENKKLQIEKMEEQNSSIRNNIVELQNSIEKIKAEVSGSSQKIEDLKNNKNAKNSKLDDIEKDIEKQFENIQNVKEQLVKIGIKKTNTEQDISDTINELWNEYEITPNNAKDYPLPTNVQETQKRVNELHNKIKELGSVNIDSIEEYKKTKERYETMCEQRLDLENTMAKLRDIIQEMTKTMKVQFSEKFKQINTNFNEVFRELFGGGKAELVLEDEENILECGIDIKAQPTGKKLQNMMLLSGGEKALTAISLLFAILKINPAPFCILDEIEAALDDVNVYRFAEFLKKFSDTTQFLVITHRKGTMEAADTVYGITMEENGISKLLSIKLKEETA